MARPALKVFVRNLPEKLQPEGFALRQSFNNCLGKYEPQTLADRPERKHQILFQAYTEAAAQTFWQDDLWKNSPHVRDHSDATIRRHVRYHSVVDTMGSSFLQAHSLSATKVHSSHWSVMIRRHLDVPVYEDSRHDLTCSHCDRRMDPFGDHATKCDTGFGYTHRHNNLRNTIARTVFKPSGLAYDLEVPFLVPNTNLRPVDILVQPGPTPPGAPLSRPTAYDVTIRSPFVTGAKSRAATSKAGAAEKADRDKRANLERNLRNALHINDTDDIPTLDWNFVPLAFDTYGAPAARVVAFIRDHARRISLRTSLSVAAAKQSIEQNISYSIWSSNAEAILSRMPLRGAALQSHTQ